MNFVCFLLKAFPETLGHHLKRISVGAEISKLQLMLKKERSTKERKQETSAKMRKVRSQLEHLCRLSQHLLTDVNLLRTRVLILVHSTTHQPIRMSSYQCMPLRIGVYII